MRLISAVCKPGYNLYAFVLSAAVKVDSLLTSTFVALHVGLILIHAALLAVAIPHFEHGFVVSLGAESERLNIALVVVSQLLAIIYLALATLTCQRLSLQRSLSKHLSVTDIHDQSSAWSGLGSALQSLLFQGVVRSALSVYLVAMYLICIAVLHTTTPALFIVQTFQYTKVNVLTTNSSLPDSLIGNTLPISTWAASILDSLPVLQYFGALEHVGLSGNVIYDIIADNNGTLPLSVNASRFDVSCGYIPAVNISSVSSLYHKKTATFTLVINSTVGPLNNGTKFTDKFQFNSLVPHSMLLSTPGGTSPFGPDPSIPFAPPTLYVISTFVFVDSSNSTAQPISMSSVPPNSSFFGGDIFPYLQVTGCTLSVSNISVVVDPKTKLMLTTPPRANLSVWEPWQWTGKETSPYEKEWTSTILSGDIPARAINTGNLSDINDSVKLPPGCFTPAATNAECVMTNAQLAILDLLQIPFLDGGSPTSPLTASLHGLENAMGDLTALIYWSASQLAPPPYASWLFDSNLPQFPRDNSPLIQRQSNYTQEFTASRLNLNVILVSVGFATSLILNTAAFLLTARRNTVHNAHPAISSVGVLQAVWLLKDHGKECRQIGAIEDPSDINLRKAGMGRIDWSQASVTNQSEELESLQRGPLLSLDVASHNIEESLTE